jgi:lipopolysaccharide biosynthesis glycosyltransferase
MFYGVQLGWHKSYITYARFLISELTHLSKVIYMDVDIIVNCDIKELWDIDFHCEGKEYAIAAIKGYKNNENSRLNLSANHCYFNSGLLVVNCDKWRKDKIFQELLEIARHTLIKLKYADQDVLNIYFDNYLPFDETYNSQPYFVKEECKETYNPKCYHFTQEKPWLKKDCFKNEIFWKYAEKTPYYEQLIYNINNKTVMEKKQKEKEFRLFADVARMKLY